MKVVAAPMSRSNSDTDATVPEQVLKANKRAGPDSAFFHAECHDDGVERPDFVLNKGPYHHAKIPGDRPEFWLW